MPNVDGAASGVVSAASPEAAMAGVAILERGGNAIDAAVAVAMCLGVTEPAGSGLGGQTTLLVQARGEPAFVVNGTSFAPAAATGSETIRDLVGRKASTVPSTPRVLATALECFGSGRVRWAEALEPAIAAATDGYRLGPFRRASLIKNESRIRRDPAATALLLPEGRLPDEGAIVSAPELASTLRRLAEHGAEDFYTGAIGLAIARDMEAGGGLITASDLAAAPDPVIEPALVGAYRGHRVSTLPPPASGWVGLLALGLLEALVEPPVGADALILEIASALQIAHVERVRRAVYERADALARCAPLAMAELAALVPTRIVRSATRSGDAGETTHFSVVDDQGMVVSVTQSLNAYYGAKVACPKTGILYNDYMREFVLGAERPKIDPKAGRPPYSSMCAMIVGRGDEPLLALGSPGDERIISAVVQVVSRWVDQGLSIEASVAAPRIHPLGGGELLVEADLAEPALVNAFEERGWIVSTTRSAIFEGRLHPYFGGVHAVASDGSGWAGAADPRRDGAARTASRAARDPADEPGAQGGELS